MAGDMVSDRPQRPFLRVGDFVHTGTSAPVLFVAHRNPILIVKHAAGELDLMDDIYG